MTLQSILTENEIKELYEIPKLNQDERKFLFSIDTDDKAHIEIFGNNTAAQINYIMQMGYYLATGNFFKFNLDDHKGDVDFILETYFPDSKKTRKISKYHHYTNRDVLISKYELKLPNPEVIKQLNNEAKALARRSVQPRYIMQETLAYCINHKIIRPAYSGMQKIVSTALNTETNRLSNLMYRLCEKDLRDQLDQLLMNDELFYNLTLLKKDQKDFSTTEIINTVGKQQMIKDLYEQSRNLINQLKISKQNIIYYANLAEHYTIWNLKQFKKKNQVRLYLLCYVNYRLLKINDHLVASFIQKINGYIGAADKYQKQQIEVIDKVDLTLRNQACKVLDLNMDEKIPDSKLRQKAFEIIPQQEYKQFLKLFRKPNFNRDYHRWEFLQRTFGSIKRNIRPVFRNINFICTNQPLVNAVSFLKEHLDKKKSFSPADDVPMDFFPKKAKELLIQKTIGPDGKVLKTINIDRYEFMVYSQLQKQIKKGNTYIRDSISYRSLENELIDIEYWHKNKNRIIDELKMPLLDFDIVSILNQFEEVVEQKLKNVNQRINDGKNQHLQLKHNAKDQITGWRLPYEGKDKNNNPLYDQLPVISIADILQFTNKKTNFINVFTHQQPKYSKSKPVPEFIFANTLANATGIELNKMKAISDIGKSEFETSGKNFVRHTTLTQASDLITSKIEKLSVFREYTLGDYGIHASVDGQKFTTKVNTIKSRYSKKYFGLLKGVVMYSLNANHLPLNLKVIAANEHESHHLLDIVENQNTGVDIKSVSGDMHSINRVNFALMHFFGYRFLPRFTSLEKKVTTHLVGFKPLSSYDGMLISPRNRVNKKLIIQEWDNILRIFASLAMKKTTQYQIIRKLSSYQANSTLNALMELDKILMTDYLLDYVDSHEVRQNVQVALNRGEAYHQLAAAISKVSGNKVLSGHNEIQLDINAQSIRLIALCIIYYNASMLSGVYNHYLQDDNEKTKQIIRFSPVAWQHINLIGKYEFFVNEKKLNIQSLIEIMTRELDKNNA